MLLEEIGDEGTRLTGKGNLPLRQVNAMLVLEKGDNWLPVEGYLNDMLKAFPRLPLAAYP